jgi:hypothetical protein
VITSLETQDNNHDPPKPAPGHPDKIRLPQKLSGPPPHPTIPPFKFYHPFQMEDCVMQTTDRMTDEEVFDLITAHPTLREYPRLEWRYWSYYTNRDFHMTEAAKLTIYDWIEIAKRLQPETLWNLLQALPHLIPIQRLTNITRRYRKVYPVRCPICHVRNRTVRLGRVHMEMCHRAMDVW